MEFDLPKLEAEALQKAADAICLLGADPYPYEVAKVAITAYKAHIAQGIKEEDERRALARFMAFREHASDNAPIAWYTWQAALRACPCKQIICNTAKGK